MEEQQRSVTEGVEDGRPERPRSGLVDFLLSIAALLIIVRISMMVLAGPGTPLAGPYQPLQSPTSGPSPAPQRDLLGTTRLREGSATPTRTRLPTLTPLPTLTFSPTPRPPKLAIAQSVFEAHQPYWATLSARYRGMVLLSYPDSGAISQTVNLDNAEGVLLWAATPPAEATLLREEPFVVAVHPASPLTGLSHAQLAALVQGQDVSLTLVVNRQSDVTRDLLGLGPEAHPNGLAPRVEADGWQAAREYVATHEGSWAFLPWEAVNFRVRALPVDGQRFDPRHPQGYPLMRRLWLAGSGALPPSLVQDLQIELRDEPPSALELVAVGDIMLDRTLKDRMRAESPHYPFEGEGTQALLSQADIAFGNLECAISERGRRQPKTYTFRADPQAVSALTYAGLDVLSLANNHTGDFGDEALLDTLSFLEGAHLVPVGAGRTLTEAHEAKIVTANGVRVAFLAYNEVPPTGFAASDDSPGSAWMEPERMVAAVRAARDKADVVVVSCHWGVEYSSNANAQQRALAQALADAGAALILGHHPHVVQGLGYAANTFIAYSLGNFVFDINVSQETLEGFALRCLIDTTGVKTVELVPYNITASRPVIVSPEAGSRVLQRVQHVTQQQGGFPQ